VLCAICISGGSGNKPDERDSALAFVGVVPMTGRK